MTSPMVVQAVSPARFRGDLKADVRQDCIQCTGLQPVLVTYISKLRRVKNPPQVANLPY